MAFFEQSIVKAKVQNFHYVPLYSEDLLNAPLDLKGLSVNRTRESAKSG
jgi:hypothetical protein